MLNMGSYLGQNYEATYNPTNPDVQRNQNVQSQVIDIIKKEQDSVEKSRAFWKGLGIIAVAGILFSLAPVQRGR